MSLSGLLLVHVVASMVHTPMILTENAPIIIMVFMMIVNQYDFNLYIIEPGKIVVVLWYTSYMCGSWSFCTMKYSINTLSYVV